MNSGYILGRKLGTAQRRKRTREGVRADRSKGLGQDMRLIFVFSARENALNRKGMQK
jgi:hypothetical protein